MGLSPNRLGPAELAAGQAVGTECFPPNTRCLFNTIQINALAVSNRRVNSLIEGSITFL
jgi:hypothetical protein